MPEGAAVPDLVLDTHVWLWVVEGDDAALSTGAIEAIGESSRSGGVLISAISVWEVAMLEAKGRISLTRPVDEWVRAALLAPGVRLLPLTPDIAIDSTRLPGTPHGDPADRMLIASARVTGARLVTCDAAIVDYASEGHVEVLDGRR